jgi:hypothetical protein
LLAESNEVTKASDNKDYGSECDIQATCHDKPMELQET